MAAPCLAERGRKRARGHVPGVGVGERFGRIGRSPATAALIIVGLLQGSTKGGRRWPGSARFDSVLPIMRGSCPQCSYRLDASVSSAEPHTPPTDEQRPSEPAQNSRLLSAEQACPRTTYVREVASQVLTTALMGIGLRRRIASSASARASFLFDSAGLPEPLRTRGRFGRSDGRNVARRGGRPGLANPPSRGQHCGHHNQRTPVSLRMTYRLSGSAGGLR